MRFVLGLSVALNLLLLTSIVAARIDTGLSEVTAAAAMIRGMEGGSGAADMRDVATVAELLGILESSELGPDAIKMLVLGWLEARYRTSYGSTPRYWEKGYSPGREALAAEYAAASAIRAALVETFGAAAVGDPAFDAVFRPLGPTYAFLGSRAQLALQELELERLASAGHGPAEAPGGTLLCRPQDVRAVAGTNSRAALHVIDLTAAEDKEYRLRFSPLAAQLRDAGIAEDEAEFRELYDLTAPLEQRQTLSEQAEVRARLRTHLGDERFDRFWSMRDPMFGVIDEYLARRGLAGHRAMAAYAIVNRSQEALLSVLGRPGDAASTAAAARRIREDETSDLSRLLGPDAAAGLQAAMNEISLRLSQGSDSAC